MFHEYDQDLIKRMIKWFNSRFNDLIQDQDLIILIKRMI